MNPQLTTRLRSLRLSGMVEALPARVAQAEAAPLAHLDFLDLLSRMNSRAVPIDSSIVVSNKQAS